MNVFLDLRNFPTHQCLPISLVIFSWGEETGRGSKKGSSVGQH